MLLISREGERGESCQCRRWGGWMWIDGGLGLDACEEGRMGGETLPEACAVKFDKC